MGRKKEKKLFVKEFTNEEKGCIITLAFGTTKKYMCKERIP